MHAFDYVEAESIAEAVSCLAENGDEARPIAGGTDLIIQMETGRKQPRVVVGIGRLPELQGIHFDPQKGLTLGAMTPLRAVETSPIIREHYPMLARAAGEIGSIQIRNLATIGGNVCNASPSADCSPPLLALETTVVIAGPEGERRMPIKEFWLGPGRTALKPGEILKAFEIPPPEPGQKGIYIKHAVRRCMDIAIVGVAGVVVLDNGTPKKARLALGAVAPTVIRVPEAEERIVAEGLSALPEVGRIAQSTARPITDQRASAEYRSAMVNVLSQRVFRLLLEG